jgi:2-isopropylmalate synthase
MEDRVRMFDTSLEEGERSPGCALSTEEKLRMARQLERLGVGVVEAGSPMNSPSDFEAVRLIARNIRGTAVAARCRPIKGEIDRAWEAIGSAGNPCLHIDVLPVSGGASVRDSALLHRVAGEATEAVRYARGLCSRVEVTIEYAPLIGAEALSSMVAHMVGAGASVVTLSDTMGYAVPEEVGELVRRVRDGLQEARVILGVHAHNDLGLALANTVAAVQNGARQVVCTVNGVGERAGCAALEEVVMLFHARKDRWGFTSGVVREELYKTSRLFGNLTGMPVQRNKPIVGANAFAYQSGPMQDGANSETIERIVPASVGMKPMSAMLSKHADRAALGQRYAELGYAVLPEELDHAYQLFRQYAERKREIMDEDLVAFLENPVLDVEEMYHLADLQVHSGTTLKPTATVELRLGNERRVDSATGDGPVDAAYKAIERITGLKGGLTDYMIKSVGTGTDGIGEVFVRVNFDGVVFHGRGMSVDVITGSALAYLEALNRALLSKRRRGASEQR